MQSYRRPSISLIPLVHDKDDVFEPPGQESLVGLPAKRYKVSRRAVILSATFFTVLILLAIFIALLTSFVQAQESVTAAASSAAASEIPS